MKHSTPRDNRVLLSAAPVIRSSFADAFASMYEGAKTVNGAVYLPLATGGKCQAKATFTRVAAGDTRMDITLIHPQNGAIDIARATFGEAGLLPGAMVLFDDFLGVWSAEYADVS